MSNLIRFLWKWIFRNYFRRSFRDWGCLHWRLVPTLLVSKNICWSMLVVIRCLFVVFFGVIFGLFGVYMMFLGVICWAFVICSLMYSEFWVYVSFLFVFDSSSIVCSFGFYFHKCKHNNYINNYSNLFPRNRLRDIQFVTFSPNVVISQ